MISYVKGDLIELVKAGEFRFIAHGCNCQKVMGSGIARQIREHFPEAYDADLNSPSNLGSYSGVYSEHYKVYIFNLYTQVYPGKGSLSLSAIEANFAELNCILPEGSKLGIPKIGAGLAGGDWSIISNIIENATPNIHVIVVEWDKQETYNAI